MRPSQPSNEQIAAEAGIAPHVAGWRDRVREARKISSLQREYEAAMVAWWTTPEGQAEHAAAEQSRARRVEIEARLVAAGCAHLVGAKIVQSKRGTFAHEHVSCGRRICSTLSARECEALGRNPGPGNL